MKASIIILIHAGEIYNLKWYFQKHKQGILWSSVQDF